MLGHTIDSHAHAETLLPAARLASVAHRLVDNAAVGAEAVVLGVLAHAALEEALAALAREHAVVATGRSIAAHHTVQDARVALLHNTRRDDAIRRARRRRRLAHGYIRMHLPIVTAAAVVILSRLRL